MTLCCGGLCLSACKPTYPKNELPRALETLIKKEYHLEGHAKLIGKTLYLAIELPELAANETEIPKEAMSKLQGAVLSIVRTSLSSDAKLKILVLTATVPEWKLHINILQSIDDIKGFLYQRISRGDYEERMILDIAREEDPADPDIEQQREISMEKFISLLIISQVNKITRANPFVGAVLKNGQLRYQSITEGTLILKISADVPASVGSLWKNLVHDQAMKVLAKYRVWYPHAITLIDGSNQIFVIPITK